MIKGEFKMIKQKLKTWNEMNKLEKTVGLAGVFILCFIALAAISGAIGAITGSDTTNKKIETKEEQKQKQTEQSQTIQESQPKQEEKVLTYEIAHEISKRLDGGKTYYVLIPEQSVATDVFKPEVEKLIRKIVSYKGKKVTIEIHDNRDSLDISYKQYGDMSLGRARTAQENQLQERHYIALYSGELEGNFYTNDLYYFPASTTSNPETGKHIKIIEFNP